MATTRLRLSSRHLLGLLALTALACGSSEDAAPAASAGAGGAGAGGQSTAGTGSGTSGGGTSSGGQGGSAGASGKAQGGAGSANGGAATAGSANGGAATAGSAKGGASGGGAGGAGGGPGGATAGGAGGQAGAAGAAGGAGGATGSSGSSGQGGAGASPGGAGGTSAGGTSAGGTSQGGSSSGGTSAGGSSSGGASSGGAGGAAALMKCGDRATHPNAWFDQEFMGAPELTGTFTKRTAVELPSFIHDAKAGMAKYAFDLKEEKAPTDPRVGLRNVTISDLKSTDAFGAALQPSDAPGAHLFLSNVTIEPNWPAWESYSTTNYDGIVLDGSEDIYAEDLTIRNWNADSALDIKSKRAELVCFITEGDGNRTLRFWKAGPHYIVLSSVNNGKGAIMWFSDCATAEVRVYQSTFNGEPEVPANKISCDKGSKPKITYLTTDPRTTGEMHPLFSQP